MTYKKVLSWAVVVFWMTVIFSLSSQVAEQSDKLSVGITGIIAQVIERAFPMLDIEISSFNYIIRKNAHFFAYLVLGVLVINALRRSGIYSYKSVALTLIVCGLYAISDEIHQLFVPGRDGQVKDVIIDSAGSVVGVGVYMTIERIFKKRRGKQPQS